MIRGHRPILYALALTAFAALGARAQYYYPGGMGYGGGGFGGWGSTVGGDIARGMGAFSAGAGVYNYDTAVANSINANTIAGINQYLYLSQQEANAREHAILAHRRSLVNKSQATAQQVAQQIRDNPTEGDVDSGAALNAILDQLSHPSILGGSTLRLANAKVPSKMIRAIPFRDSSDAITIALDQLTEEKSWPPSLRNPKFDAERQAYIKAVDAALEEDKAGDLKPETIQRVRRAISDLYTRVGETIPTSRQPDHLEAMNYLKGLAGFSRMLERGNFEQVLGELEKIQTTTAGNLIAFMHTYNLRFGAATTPGQREAYRELYPILASTREKLIGKAGEGPALTSPGNVAPNPPTALFHGIDDKHLQPSPNPSRGDTTPNLPGSPR